MNRYPMIPMMIYSFLLKSENYLLQEFRNRIRSLSPLPLNRCRSLTMPGMPCWEIFRPNRWHILEKASKHFRTFLLSNTNAIHLPYYYNRIQQQYTAPTGMPTFSKRPIFHMNWECENPMRISFSMCLKMPALNPKKPCSLMILSKILKLHDSLDFRPFI